MFLIKGNTTYAKNGIVYLAYYDINKNFISRPNIPSSTLTTPANAVYARVSSNEDKSLWQLNEGETLLTYETPATGIYPYTDKTLTKDNMPANAKTVGDKFNSDATKLQSLDARTCDLWNNWEWENNVFINADGVRRTNVANVRTSYPVSVSKGDIVVVRGNGGNAALLSKVTTDGDTTTYNVLVSCNTEDILVYTHEMTEDCQIVISGRSNRASGNIEGHIKKNVSEYVNKLNGLSIIADNIQRTIGTSVESYKLFKNTEKFITTSGVEQVGSTAVCCTDFIPYYGGDITIRGKSGVITALLAFYTGPYPELFISGSAISGADKNDVFITVYESDIPAGTKYIRSSGMASNNVPSKNNTIGIVSLAKIQNDIEELNNTINPVKEEPYKRFCINSTWIKTDGSTNPSENTAATPFMVYDGTDITVRGRSGVTTALLVYYAADKSTVLGYVNGSENNDILVTINKNNVPIGTAFVRTTGLASNLSGISAVTNYISLTEYASDNKYDLSHGQINSNGKIKGVCDDAFYSSIITTLFYKIKNNTVKILGVPSELTLTVYWYRSDKSFISSSSTPDTVPQGAIYYRFSLVDNRDVEDTTIELIPVIYGAVETSFNIDDTTNSYHYRNFTYEVHDVSGIQVTDRNPSQALVDSGELLYDNGIVMFPPNYSSDGEPVKIAIFCHGSGGMYWGKTSMPYVEMCDYIRKEGYLVFVINGITNKYYDKYYSNKSEPNNFNNLLDNLGTPIAMACYKAAYNYIVKNYNVQKQCVAWGKSLGGVMVGNMVYRGEIPLVAAGGHGPTCDVVGLTLRNRPSAYKAYYAEALGMSTPQPTWSDDPRTTVEEQAYFIANIDKVIGYNPIYNGVFGLDLTQAITTDYASPYANDSNEEHWAALKVIYANLPKIIPVPYKIWEAADDVQVDWHRPTWFIEMGKRANQVCEMRYMPLNTGGHGCTDYGHATGHENEDPVTTTVTPRYYPSEMEVPIAYIELVAWWRRFGG